jgi:hypothetical protein
MCGREVADDGADANALVRDPLHVRLVHRLIPDLAVGGEPATLRIGRRDARVMQRHHAPGAVEHRRTRRSRDGVGLIPERHPVLVVLEQLVLADADLLPFAARVLNDRQILPDDGFARRAVEGEPAEFIEGARTEPRASSAAAMT